MSRAPRASGDALRGLFRIAARSWERGALHLSLNPPKITEPCVGSGASPVQRHDRLRSSNTPPLTLVRAPFPAPETRPEAEIVAAAIQGSSRDALELWDRYAPLVRRLMARGLGSRADADDGVQDVFIKVFRSLPSLRQAESIRSYVVAITMTTIRTELRKRRLRRLWGLESQGGTLPEPPTAPSDVGVRLALKRLEAALDMLKPDDRIAFCLRHVEAMELTEVASAMGWSLASTKRYLTRAKQRLWVLVGKDPVLAPYLESAGVVGKERL